MDMGTRLFRDGIIAAGIILLCFLCFFPACTKTTVTVPVVASSSPIAIIVQNGSNLTMLDSALKKAGLFSSLDGAAPPFYTLFAPPDAAWTLAGLTDSSIYEATPAYLKRLMLYHMIITTGNGLTTWELPQGTDLPVATASLGDTVYVSVNPNGVFINGNLLTQTNIVASNGIMHAIQNVLFPANGTILQTLNNLSQTDTTITVFLKALNYASEGSTNLNSLLTSSGLYTGKLYSIFVPTNNAFRAYFGDTTSVNFSLITPDSLATIITRQILNGRVFASDFVPGSGIPSLYGMDSVNFSASYANVLVQNGDSTFANVISANILATNGVIYKTDQVLVP
jgi:uncharacterized surface protein with fasciclin (FAS1) repeats